MLNSMERLVSRRARQFIATPSYRSKRMERMNVEIEYWLLARDNAKTTLQREFSKKMAEMYHNRYKWYLTH